MELNGGLFVLLFPNKIHLFNLLIYWSSDQLCARCCPRCWTNGSEWDKPSQMLQSLHLREQKERKGQFIWISSDEMGETGANYTEWSKPEKCQPIPCGTDKSPSQALVCIFWVSSQNHCQMLDGIGELILRFPKDLVYGTFHWTAACSTFVEWVNKRIS